MANPLPAIPAKRYYQHHEVLLIRRIRELLYDQGFTINGARNRLAEVGPAGRVRSVAGLPIEEPAQEVGEVAVEFEADKPTPPIPPAVDAQSLRQELLSIRELLSV